MLLVVTRPCSTLLAVSVIAFSFAPLSQAQLILTGSPGYDSTTATGFYEEQGSWVNNNGTAVGAARKKISGSDKGTRALRWDHAGTEAVELGTLGTDPSGYVHSVARAVNDAGIAVGYSQKYISGSDKGVRAVRWNPSGSEATELGNLGVPALGYTQSHAYAVISFLY
jgi:hypothetical protein